MESPARKRKMTDISHLDNPQFSDLLIQFSGREVHAHKVIVCQKSGYFRNALEKDFAESHTGIVDLKDHDEIKIIYVLLRHIYGHPYDQSIGTEPDEATPSKDLLFHVDIFAAADYYDVPSLRQLIADKFPVLMRDEWERSIEAAIKVPDVGRSELSSPQDNLNTALSKIFANQNADTALQRVAIDFCTPRIPRLVEDHTFKVTLKDTGALGAAILDEICASGRVAEGCLKCDQVFGRRSGSTSHYCWGKVVPDSETVTGLSMFLKF